MMNRKWIVIGLAGAALGLSGCINTAWIAPLSEERTPVISSNAAVDYSRTDVLTQHD